MNKKLLLRSTLLTLAFLLPLLLNIFANCGRGLLGVLRSSTAYLIMHPGGSYDYNNLARTDMWIVYGISTLFVGLFFFTKEPRTKNVFHQIILPLVLTVLVEAAIFSISWGVSWQRCFLN